MSKVIVHNFTQRDEDWHKHRKQHLNASDASAMLDISPHKSRDAFIREKATNITPEVDAATQRLFDEGHRLEALARPIAEGIIGEILFSPTLSKVVDGLPLSASFDGLTIMEDVAWECKTMNAKLKASLPDIIPEMYHPQLEQQLLISGADKVLFMAYDGETELHCLYKSDKVLRKKLINGWGQFVEDWKSWTSTNVEVKPVATSIESLPALNIQITGGVTKTNLSDYKRFAMNFIHSISTDLETDEDFANADALVKFCGATEKELEAVKKAALAQTADISELFSIIDDLKSEMRTKRLELDKLVKSRKQVMREEIVIAASFKFADHIEKINRRFPDSICILDIRTNFGNVIKGKRTIESLHNAVNTELARCKIESNEMADLIDGNVKKLGNLIDKKYGFLFPDMPEIITKSEDDLVNLAIRRISKHKKAEKAKLEVERERIRKEEEAKAEAKERKAASERERIRAEEEAKKYAAERREAEEKDHGLAKQNSDIAKTKSTPVNEVRYITIQIKSLEVELENIKADLATLLNRQKIITTALRKAESEHYILGNKITLEDVELSSKDGRPWFNEVAVFANWLEKNSVKPFCEWNGRLYKTSDVIAGRMTWTSKGLLKHVGARKVDKHDI